jgi:copper chaperone CopZ
LTLREPFVFDNHQVSHQTIVVRILKPKIHLLAWGFCILTYPLVMPSALGSSLPNPETSSDAWVAVVKGMSCPLCSNNIEKQLSRIKGVDSVKIDLSTGRIIIRFSSPVSKMENVIQKAIKRAGFTVGAVSPWGEGG